MTCQIIEFPLPSRYNVGRGNCGMGAIVLRDLTMNIEAYFNWAHTNIDAAYATNGPKSVHYAVSHAGAIYRLVKASDTAWGLDAFNGQFPYWQASCGNAQFIYIGLEGGAALTSVQYEALVNLLCCLSIDLNFPINETSIITEYDLDENKTGIRTLPTLLIPDVIGCKETGGVPELPTVADLADRIDALEECCETVKNDLADQKAATNGLPDAVNGLTDRVNIVEGTVGDHKNRIGELEGQVTALQNQILALMNILEEHKACIEKVCPTPDKCQPITYSLEPRNSMLLTPNVPVWLNFPNKIEDTPGQDSVIPGPLWAAKLECACNYSISVEIGLEPSEYCAGRSVWVDVVVNGDKYRVETVTPGAGNATVMLAGSIPFSVPPVVNDVHVMVGTNDVTTPYKTVRYGNIRIACV